METLSHFVKVGLGLLSVGIISGGLACSSASKQAPGKAEEAGSPPAVVNPHVEPQSVSLNEKFEVSQPVDVIADVKSIDSGLDKVSLRMFFSPDTEEKLKFFKRPVEFEMQRVGGTTWRARLTKNELAPLAISGQTLKYQGQVYAKNDRGQITVSGQPVELTIKTAPVVEGRKG
jgi:hypothetical protein